MPMVGLGTFTLNDKQSIKTAIAKVGYRHLDCAYKYENEHIIGEAIKELIDEGVVKREELCIVTKIWPTQMDKPKESLLESLKKL